MNSTRSETTQLVDASKLTCSGLGAGQELAVTMRRLALVLACLVSPSRLVPATELDEWQARRDRLVGHTTSLFKAVLATTNIPQNPCPFAASWGNHAVPHSIAAEYLGLTIDANLTPSDIPAQPAAVIDPASAMTTSFCETEMASRAPDDMEVVGGMLRDDGQRAPIRRHVAFTFPIFSNGYQRAIFVEVWTSYAWYARPGVAAKWQFFGVSGEAKIYDRRGDRWELEASETLFHGH